MSSEASSRATGAPSISSVSSRSTITPNPPTTPEEESTISSVNSSRADTVVAENGEHDEREPLLHPRACTVPLIPVCVIRNWKCSCTACAVLLGILTMLFLALVAVFIFWVVEVNQRSHRNISLSTYKEAASLSHTADHLFLEDVCISASNPPPYPTQITIATIECSPPDTIDTSFHFQGVLIKGQQSSPDLVDHPGLVFYWNRGTVINLITSIPENVNVTVFILTDENTFISCLEEHIKPKEGFYHKWSIGPNSPRCENNGKKITCNFSYNVTRSDIHYMCFIRKRVTVRPLHPYTYTLTGELKSYNISQAQSPKMCDLKYPNSCCAKYGSVFKGLLRNTCIIIKTDIPNEAMHSKDVGVVFTVTVSSSRRLSVVWLSVSLAIVCIITAVVLTVLCVATIVRARNGN